MGLRDTADEEGFFRERNEPHSFKRKPYQQMQARLSTGAGGLGLPAAVVRRFSASLGNLTGTLPAVIAALRGPLGESVKEKCQKRPWWNEWATRSKSFIKNTECQRKGCKESFPHHGWREP